MTTKYAYLEDGPYSGLALQANGIDVFGSELIMRRNEGPKVTYVGTDRVNEYGARIYTIKENANE